MSGRADSTAAVLIGSQATLIEAIVSTGFIEGLEIRNVPNTVRQATTWSERFGVVGVGRGFQAAVARTEYYSILQNDKY
ncbi:hypothetical protein OUZ56_029780 [Daphnia magna]|uniref:Uncharacterized protein n=1 Tax=Daphnia magna TaxID=35525 RepID=A0ABR0B7T8_9CRUS|nr:hypothetical protein OUZ56_029780 [Daphnia magna]